MLVVCSLFSETTHLDNYFVQIASLRDSHTGEMQLVLLEGNCPGLGDELEHRAKTARIPTTIIHKDVERVYRSVEDANRFRVLAGLGNAVLSAVPPCNALLWIESDLLFDTSVILTLLDHLKDESIGVCAPLPFYQPRPEQFYDTFAYRDLTGRRWDAFPPYTPNMRCGLMDLGSVGSLYGIRGTLVPLLSFPEQDCVVGLCRQVRERGYRVVADTRLTIWHPRRSYD